MVDFCVWAEAGGILAMSARRFWVMAGQVTAKGQKWESWGKEFVPMCVREMEQQRLCLAIGLGQGSI